MGGVSRVALQLPLARHPIRYKSTSNHYAATTNFVVRNANIAKRPLRGPAHPKNQHDCVRPNNVSDAYVRRSGPAQEARTRTTSGYESGDAYLLVLPVSL